MFSPITKIIKEANKGKIFILVDDENRENNDIVNIEIDIIAKYIKNLKK